MPVNVTPWGQGSLPQDAAVALCQGGVGLHTGLAYRDTQAQAERVIHLAWHHRLQNDTTPSPTEPWFVVTPDMDELELVRLASFCQRLAGTNPRIPYALRFASSGFDAQGRFLPGPGEIGLTCASFVMAVFEAARVPLLSKESWEERSPARQSDDARIQQKLAAYLGQSAAPSHAAAVQREVGCARFRSEEVAAASSFPSPTTPRPPDISGSATRPATFSQVEPVGRDLKHRVEALLAAPSPPAAPAPAPRARARRRT